MAVHELRTLGPRQLAWLREFVPHFAELESAWQRSRERRAPTEEANENHAASDR